MTPDTPKSPARVAAGRANGLKSRGAKTPEGKAASALNATTHGFSARTIVLSVEDSEAFHEMRDNYIAHLKPANPVEEQMLDDIVIAKWRHRRLTTVETPRSKSRCRMSSRKSTPNTCASATTSALPLPTARPKNPNACSPPSIATPPASSASTATPSRSLRMSTRPLKK